MCAVQSKNKFSGQSLLMLKKEMLLSRSRITFVHIIVAYLLLIEILKCINLPFSHVSKCRRPAQRGGASSHDIAWPVIDKLGDFMGTYVNVSLMLDCRPQAINLNYSGFERKKKRHQHIPCWDQWEISQLDIYSVWKQESQLCTYMFSTFFIVFCKQRL